MSDDKPEVHQSKDNVASDPEGSVQTTETEPTASEAADLKMMAPKKPDEPVKDAGHGHAHAHGDSHGDDHGHGLAHTMPLPLLFGVLGALLALTIATVAVTSIDLGAQGNLVVAMVIATVKAALVCVFFMHLLWDKKFNAVLFLTSVLLLILFLSLTTNDRGEYQQAVDDYRALQLQK
jgi:cytochrome c oxidase subunit IV